jgi:hypothetical protein
MSTNCQILNNYITGLSPGVLFVRPYEKVVLRPETMACLRCGSPYMLLTPYELCNPVLRDLCDQCILDLPILSLSLSLSSGSDPDLIRAVKTGGIRSW